MYINSLFIEKYKIFEDIKIEFQTPKENENIVNIIAGVNGSGKSTLLEYILIVLSGAIGIHNKFFNSNKIISGNIVIDNNMKIDKDNLRDYNKYKSNQEKSNQYINGKHTSPRIIYIPSNMTFNYKSKSEIDTSYKFSNIVDINSLLGNAELFIKNYVISKERSSNKSDPTERTKDAIESFNNIFRNSELVTKLINLDIHNNNRPIFETLNGEKVTIENLSSGEQQLYARVVSLMILNPHNSIVLIDEPEIALHPKWQIDIMKIYANIGENNQFIVTTHSPFIISQTHYLNLIFLVKEDEKIVAKQFHNSDTPPHRDINTLVKTIMGADYLPRELEELQLRYRELFDSEEENSKEALELEKQILEWESPNSSFWQGIAFDKELRDI